MSESGGVFRREWFAQRYAWTADGRLVLPGGMTVHWESLRRFATVDLALSTRTSADYTVVAVFGQTNDDRLVMLDLDRARREGPEHVPTFKRLVKKWDLPIVWVEKAGIGLGIIQEARRHGVPVRELVADKDKHARALAATPRMEAAKFLLPKDLPSRGWSMFDGSGTGRSRDEDDEDYADRHPMSALDRMFRDMAPASAFTPGGRRRSWSEICRIEGFGLNPPR
jgi:predicted phage terminase large subunit-like protein